jgi:hypothetical protein
MTKAEIREMAVEFASDTFNALVSVAHQHAEIRHALRGRWDDTFGLRRAVEAGADVVAFNVAAAKEWAARSREWQRDDDVEMMA